MLPNSLKAMAVRSLQLIETGTYQPMYYRPYEVNTDGALYQTIADRLTHNPVSATNGALSGVAGQAITPSARPQGELYMPNGWNEKRIRFMMAIDFEYITGTRGTYWLQGYTTYTGVSHNGHLDEDMVFYINSCTTTTVTQIPTPTGIMMQDTIRDSIQVLTGPGGSLMDDHNHIYSMRPEDLYMSMELQQSTSYAGDTSIKDSRSMINFVPHGSKRANTVASEYLGEMISSYMGSREALEFGSNERDMIGIAATSVRTKSLRENFFMQYLVGRRSGLAGNQFTMKDISALDPMVGSKTTYFKSSELMKIATVMPTVEAGMTEHWMGSDIVTQMSSMLASAIPTIMLRSLISVVSFRSTNHDIGGRHTMAFMDVKSISNTEVHTLTSLFQRLFEQTILPDLTQNGMVPYMLDMSCDITGDTWITLKLDSYPSITFTAPSFCDSLFTPVITTNYNHLVDSAVKMDGLLNYMVSEVYDNRPTHTLLSSSVTY